MFILYLIQVLKVDRVRREKLVILYSLTNSMLNHFDLQVSQERKSNCTRTTTTLSWVSTRAW